jgi:hypothetical protein
MLRAAAGHPVDPILQAHRDIAMTGEPDKVLLEARGRNRLLRIDADSRGSHIVVKEDAKRAEP